MADYHVYPVSDLKPHETKTRNCECGTRIEQFGVNAVVIHRSFDGREIRERAIIYAESEGKN